MKKKIFLTLLFFVVSAVSFFPVTASANEEKREKKLFFLSPSAEWYFPSSQKVQDAFGNSWGGLGVDINPEAFGWGRKRPDQKVGEMRFSPYFGYFNADNGDNEAHIVPVGIDARWMLKEWGSTKVYAGVGLAGYGVKFKDWEANIDTGWKAAGGGRILFEIDGKWLTFHTSYNAVSDVEGYNFGGFTIGAKIKFYF